MKHKEAQYRGPKVAFGGKRDESFRELIEDTELWMCVLMPGYDAGQLLDWIGSFDVNDISAADISARQRQEETIDLHALSAAMCPMLKGATTGEARTHISSCKGGDGFNQWRTLCDWYWRRNPV